MRLADDGPYPSLLVYADIPVNEAVGTAAVAANCTLHKVRSKGIPGGFDV